MPIGIVSDSDFLSELSQLTSKPKSVDLVSSDEIPLKDAPVQIIDKPSKGRDSGDTNVPESLRKIIGEEQLLNGRQSALSLASSFGISASSVSAYAKGATSTSSYNSPKKSIVDHINKSRQRAISKASKTLNAALGSISQEKLDYAEAKDLSAIAKDMSVIIKNLEPPAEVVPSESSSKAPQFVIFAPQFRKEESFDVITVNE